MCPRLSLAERIRGLRVVTERIREDFRVPPRVKLETTRFGLPAMLHQDTAMVSQEIRNVFSTGGSTIAQLTSDGDKMLVAGTHGVIRVYKVGHDDEEPDTLDIKDEVSDLATSKDHFAVSSKDGSVELFSISQLKSLGQVVRSGLPIRGIAFTHGGSRLVAAGDDDEVQIVQLSNIDQVIKFKSGDQVHDVSYNPVRDTLAMSLSSGDIKIFSTSSEEPRLLTTISGEIASLIYMDDDEYAEDNIATVKVQWHPRGHEFAIPSQNRTIKIFDEEYKQAYTFVRLHEKPITALEWSPCGSFLASSDLSNRLIIWDVETRRPLVDERLPHKAFNLSWSPAMDGKYDIVAGSEHGDIFHFKQAVEVKKDSHADRSVLDDIMNEVANEDSDGDADDVNLFSEASLDGDTGEDLRDFVDDDGFIDEDVEPISKRAYEEVEEHVQKPKRSRTAFTERRSNTIKPFSQGCTPFIGDRRYLTINSLGYVTSVKHEAHSSITVTFFDTSNREYHFDDIHGYDIASLTSDGLLLGYSGGRILYRPHTASGDSWEKVIPRKQGEILTSVSLSDSMILVCSSHGYIRGFSLFGIPQSLEKSGPVLACATSTRYIFTISLSNQQLVYNLQDLEGRYMQRDLVLPLEFQGELLLRGLFFSTYGDPVVVDFSGVVFVLSRWRSPLQAKWVPLLDADVRVREVGGKGDLKVWPLGLHGDNLNCIISRSQFPPYPLPLPSELEVRIPLKEAAEDTEDPEEELVRAKTMGELLGETLANDGEIFDDDEDRLEGYALAYDRALLKLIVAACSEEKSAQAWGLAQELKQEKALAAAAKVAERVGLVALVNRINKLREQRME